MLIEGRGGRRQGQASTEFLLTYGFVILTIFVLAGAIYYSGIFEVPSLLREEEGCEFQGLLGCGESLVGSDGVSFEISNDGARDMVIREVVVDSDAIVGTCDNSCAASYDVVVEAGGRRVITLNSEGCAFKDTGRDVNDYRVNLSFVWGANNETRNLTTEFSLRRPCASSGGCNNSLGVSDNWWNHPEDVEGDFTCKHIRRCSRRNGLYPIKLNGGDDVFEAYCDMTTDGGGWTLAVRALHGFTSHQTSGSTIDPLTSDTQNSVAKLSNADIIAIGRTNSNDSAYETRFLFSDPAYSREKYFFEWNNGHAPDFNNNLTIGPPYKQTRKTRGIQVDGTYNYRNETIRDTSYSCARVARGPFSKASGANPVCDPLWGAGSAAYLWRFRHTGFLHCLNCDAAIDIVHPSNSEQNRSGTMWVR